MFIYYALNCAQWWISFFNIKPKKVEQIPTQVLLVTSDEFDYNELLS